MKTKTRLTRSTIPLLKGIRQEMVLLIRNHNKYLPWTHLGRMPFWQLLANIHPLYRDEYRDKLEKKGLLDFPETNPQRVFAKSHN